MRENHPNLEDGSVNAPVRCSYCGSQNTRIERKRGPGRCRTVHYCEECDQPFEEFR